jgi:hypothetical protein
LKIKLVSILIFGVIIFSGCEDDPSSVGQNLIEDQDVAKFYSIDSNEDNLSIITGNFVADINYGTSARTLVGSADNLTATALMKFVYLVPDTLEEALNNSEVTIISSELKLRVDYYFGTTTSEKLFSIYRITNDWLSTDFYRENLLEIQNESEDLSLIDSDYDYSDSLITIKFDNQSSFEFLSHSADTNNFFNHGILFQPSPSLNNIIGFPALSSSVDSETLPKLSTIIQFSNGQLDTLNAVLTSDAFAVVGDAPSEVDGINFLQGGLPLRSKLQFDLSSLPETAVAVNAELTVTYDSLNSVFGSKKSDSLVVTFLKDFEANEIDSTTTSLVLKREGNTFTGDIKSFIQLWIDEKDNNGMQVRLFREDILLTKLALYDHSNSSSLKPHLKIIYTDIK